VDQGGFVGSCVSEWLGQVGGAGADRVDWHGGGDAAASLDVSGRAHDRRSHRPGAR
jgi:hypothetical protein